MAWLCSTICASLKETQGTKRHAGMGRQSYSIPADILDVSQRRWPDAPSIQQISARIVQPAQDSTAAAHFTPVQPSTVDSRPHAGSAAGAAIAALLGPTLPASHEARCRQVNSGPDCASHWQSSTCRLCAQLAGCLLLLVWADGLMALIMLKQLAQGLAAMPCCGLTPAGPVCAGAAADGLAHLTMQWGAADAHDKAQSRKCALHCPAPVALCGRALPYQMGSLGTDALPQELCTASILHQLLQ